jgi:predicted TIM-barrel fold metal-dependent hydrolase
MPELRIDCDFLAQRATLPLIMPFLPLRWQKYMSTGGNIDRAGQMLPEPPFPRKAPAWGSSPEAARSHLDQRGVELALLNPGDATGVGALAHPDLGAAAAAATNDWLAKTWLDFDPRFRSTIVVSLRDPKQAAAEVRRWAGDPRVLQVLVSWPPGLLGDRSFRPFLEAAAESRLAIMIEFGGAYAGANKAMLPIGFPTSELEFKLGAEYGAQPHLLSLVMNGWLDRLPTLNVVFSGFGLAWLPSLIWRLDDEYTRATYDRPRLEHEPSHYVRRNLRFTTRTVELSPQPTDLVALLRQIGGQDLLLFASGEAGDDAAETFVDALPIRWRAQVLRENARSLYTRRGQLSEVIR